MPLPCRLVTLAAGAAGGRFLKYEEDAPVVAAQTAYGIEAEVEGYDDAYPKGDMLFMDFRRHHTGLYDGTAPRLKVGPWMTSNHSTTRIISSDACACFVCEGVVGMLLSWHTAQATCGVTRSAYCMLTRYQQNSIEVLPCVCTQAGKHCNAGDGQWGTNDEPPSFLYAMPLGGNRVFLEETCLVAKPALPFAVLKRRLDRRLRAMGVRVTQVHEEEWSYIPVGGPLPLPNQTLTAFGAAANLVHPATGFSVARSFREAPAMADALEGVLKQGLSVADASTSVWATLWPQEKRTQVSHAAHSQKNA